MNRSQSPSVLILHRPAPSTRCQVSASMGVRVGIGRIEIAIATMIPALGCLITGILSGFWLGA